MHLIDLHLLKHTHTHSRRSILEQSHFHWLTHTVKWIEHEQQHTHTPSLSNNKEKIVSAYFVTDAMLRDSSRLATKNEDMAFAVIRCDTVTIQWIFTELPHIRIYQWQANPSNSTNTMGNRTAKTKTHIKPSNDTYDEAAAHIHTTNEQSNTRLHKHERKGRREKTVYTI